MIATTRQTREPTNSVEQAESGGKTVSIGDVYRWTGCFVNHRKLEVVTIERRGRGHRVLLCEIDGDYSHWVGLYVLTHHRVYRKIDRKD